MAELSFENSATGFEPHWEASVYVVQPLKCKPEQMMFFGADWYEPKCLLNVRFCHKAPSTEFTNYLYCIVYCCVLYCGFLVWYSIVDRFPMRVGKMMYESVLIMSFLRNQPNRRTDVVLDWGLIIRTQYSACSDF